MKCLRCTAEMQVEVRGEGHDAIEIDLCSSCRGMWLDATEFKKLDDNFFVDVETIEYEKVEASPEDGRLVCPRCPGNLMLRKVRPRAFPGVVIDTCGDCHGYWLDRGELEKMGEISDRLLIASLADE